MPLLIYLIAKSVFCSCFYFCLLRQQCFSAIAAKVTLAQTANGAGDAPAKNCYTMKTQMSRTHCSVCVCVYVLVGAWRLAKNGLPLVFAPLLFSLNHRGGFGCVACGGAWLGWPYLLAPSSCCARSI